jgi:hypothetical protein
MEERRQHHRHSPDQQLELVEQHSGQRLGRLVDLSQDGFMLFSEGPLSVDSVLECRLVLDQPILDNQVIEFAADCLWSRPGADSQHCWAGFHIIDIAEDQSATLRELLERLDTQ